MDVDHCMSWLVVLLGVTVVDCQGRDLRLWFPHFVCRALDKCGKMLFFYSCVRVILCRGENEG